MIEAIKVLRDTQKQYFYSGETRGIAFRREQLEKLKKAIQEREPEILAALKKDLNKGEHEAYLTEIGYVYSEIKDLAKNVDYWAAPAKEKTPLTHTGSKSFVFKEPYGVTLIIAPWNYPFQLALAPLIGAIAAGNTAIVKPSELTPNTSGVIRDLIAATFPEKYIAVVEGDAETAKALLDEKMDYIFFTGSTAIGKKVMKAAAEHLTPVTLELGGKSPAIVTEDADLKLAAKRIVWGKFLNAGQTCVAPDYVLVSENRRRKFLKHLVQYTKKWFGSDARRDRAYPKIVNEKHVERIEKLIDPEKLFYGGTVEKESRFIEPTILLDVSMEDDVMGEEIFGPVLPIMFYENEHEVIDLVRMRPNPLALYLFTENKDSERFIIENLAFGGGCINDTIMHLATPYLPFGGIGESGMGAYHGKYSFDTFTHDKSILKQTTSFDLPIRYNPSSTSLKTLRKMWE
ncbi:aldehyde dehydrogenase [Salisediminibacterium halotolerans]|uniref:aldehyde dehydrogenase n=1 Tax=Salisediminibacterium halotolerans TaxID=517425 RepID=UPI000EAF0426|nr:aldehyde dehydrogenase [Salisediminibacterium halotolerans]RLJ69286.1 aldehyde dehydrogenase (NAD+) [Actinophytocola xinjiangensis]RPE86979.1 aldehyde dehydrogenase (NAD+) [Salisediminibacterium halotolerans]TWG32288.1 aldehyde dehydrogenase (NAD+) [Salisediminibacterium halotolerans]GEL08817.1 aldehyde dehydrogenase [Salisediminibacterium halotolerans]